MKITPGLHRIGDDIIAAYLVVTDDGLTLIDAGLPGYRRELRRELASIGRTESDIRGIILTHADPDHIGFAQALHAEHGTPVYVSSAEAGYARRDRPAGPAAKAGGFRLGAALSFVWVGITHAGRIRPISEVLEVEDGQELDLPGRPRIIALTGHTPGHIAIHVPAVEALFVGDGLTTRHVLTGDTTPQDAPFSEDPAAAQASLERLREVSASRVCPGHGPVWTGTPDALVSAVVASRR